MQVVSIHASPRWSLAAQSPPCLAIALPKPGLSSVGGLGEWGGPDREPWSPYQAAFPLRASLVIRQSLPHPNSSWQ